MTWDATQPQNTTKLRNLGAVIRPNWEAIEAGDSSFIPQALNLADRTPLGVANDPIAIADTMILYSKQDVSGNPQIYAIDPSSIITKLTNGNTLTAAANGKYILPNGLTFIWGKGLAKTSWYTNTFPGSGFANNAFSIVVTKIDDFTYPAAVRSLSKTTFQSKSVNEDYIYYFAVGN